MSMLFLHSGTKKLKGIKLKLTAKSLILTHEKQMLAYAEEKHIEISDFDLPKCKACSVFISNAYYIGLDKQLSHIQRKDALMHELGHCETDSFYDRLAGANTVSRMEARANRWAYSHFIDREALLAAVRAGCRMLWEFAEHFDITESFMQGVFDYYKSEGFEW